MSENMVPKIAVVKVDLTGALTGHGLDVGRDDAGGVWVTLASLCATLGLSVEGQRARMYRAAVGWMRCIPIEGRPSAGTLVIAADNIDDFLVGIVAPHAIAAAGALRDQATDAIDAAFMAPPEAFHAGHGSDAAPLHRAVAASSIFNGRVDCYVLDNGQRILSTRGIVRGISGNTGGADFGNLGRYLARLPARFAHLRAEPTLAFATPDGSHAIGRPATFLVDLCRAYAGMLTAGDLHAAQTRLAHNAINLLAMLANKGIEAMIDEACGCTVRVAEPVTPPAPAGPTFTLADVAALIDDRLANFATHVTIGEAGRREILSTLHGCAEAIVPYDPDALARNTKEARRARKRLVSAWRTSADNELRGRLGFYGVGRCWSNLPIGRMVDARLALLEMTRRAQRTADTRPAPGQQSNLFDLEAVRARRGNAAS